MKKNCILLLLYFLGLFFHLSADPLPSWNEGQAKTAILNFINTTTDQQHPNYVPPKERIAVFDQDGTLWIEQPIYTQIAYTLYRVKKLVEKQPELADVDPYKTILTENREAIEKLNIEDLKKVIYKTATGMSVEEYQDQVKQWLSFAKDPRWKRNYTELIYQPMLELIRYFQCSGYKTYIVTGGWYDFVRVYADQLYNIPPEQVIGSATALKYGYDANHQPQLMKDPSPLLHNNYGGKAENINLIIGKRPNAAFGNSTGDQQMLEYAKAGNGIRLAMLVLHDDGVREYAYGPAQGLPDSKNGTFTQQLYNEAQKSGWIVISMKNDWKTIFPFENSCGQPELSQ